MQLVVASVALLFVATANCYGGFSTGGSYGGGGSAYGGYSPDYGTTNYNRPSSDYGSTNYNRPSPDYGTTNYNRPVYSNPIRVYTRPDYYQNRQYPAENQWSSNTYGYGSRRPTYVSNTVYTTPRPYYSSSYQPQNYMAPSTFSPLSSYSGASTFRHPIASFSSEGPYGGTASYNRDRIVPEQIEVVSAEPFESRANFNEYEAADDAVAATTKKAAAAVSVAAAAAKKAAVKA